MTQKQEQSITNIIPHIERLINMYKQDYMCMSQYTIYTFKQYSVIDTVENLSKDMVNALKKVIIKYKQLYDGNDSGDKNIRFTSTKSNKSPKQLGLIKYNKDIQMHLGMHILLLMIEQKKQFCSSIPTDCKLNEKVVGMITNWIDYYKEAILKLYVQYNK